MDSPWRQYLEILEGSEPIESGTHPTARNNSNFLKSHSGERDSFPNWFFPAYKFLFDQEIPEEPSSEQKAYTEFKLLKEQDNIGIAMPCPIFQEDNFIESEFIPGETLRSEIENNTDDISEILRQLGSMIQNLHESGYARWDNRTSNIIVDRTGWEEGPTPYLIDNEYIIPDATKADQELDLVSFIDSINSEEPYKFNELYSGFREGYGNIPTNSIALAGLRTFSEEILNQNFDKAYNSLKNTISGIQENNTKSDYSQEKQYKRFRANPSKE